MRSLVMPASLAITLALVLYTIGVFSERRAGRLGGRQLALFWCGLACDTTGTTLMTMIAHSGGTGAPAIHGITGALAIVLMLFHAVWATVVFVRHDDGVARTFHRLSTVVWLVWLVPYLIGLFMGMPMLHFGGVQATLASLVVVAVIALVLCARGGAKRK
ncbi:HsmA family protein [Olsenella porci]|uniref:TIGR03987 family protein n=1 Tax=Olsenella porci TaxID=2652279 RepID=A0A6N7XRC1_9ACTN|nr:HsmA family protein [Olsenella porci]MST72536.1 TIGR03987 family protein [Olsenella porci]